jgi:predicted acetyltransferase
MEVRNLTKEDLNQVIKLHQYAYGFWTDKEVTEADFAHIIPEDTLGLFEKGELVSVLTIMKTQQSVRGVLKGMGGISMVGTFPEARMKGYVRTIMQSAFLEMKETGFCVSMLEPFRETFYLRFGYVPAYDQLRLKAPLEGLRFPSDQSLGDEWTFNRVPGREAKDAYMTFIQDFAPKVFHGYAFNPDIRDEEWNYRNKDRLFVFVKKGGNIEALARYKIKGYMHFEQSELIVQEMYWRNPAAQAALFNYLGKHRDQFQTIRMDVPYGADFQRWFEDLKDWIEIKFWHPWMIRIIDAKEALRDLPAPVDGELSIKLTDPQCGWNNATYLLQSTDGKLAASSTKRTAQIETTIHGLSALVYGTHSLAAIEYAGWIKGLSNPIRSLIQAWFAQLSLYNPYTF